MTLVMKISNLTFEYPLPRRYRKEDILPSGIRNITLDLTQGEILGVVGRNGSGKSTLLKLMAGIFPPDLGEIAMRGSVSLLAGVGVGFSKELTGRENTYLYGALMGRSKAQINDLIDDIQDFAELDHHFDRPLRTYSSGMKSRLGISVATAFQPDLLLIDEVLGVGDVSFRAKSMKKVKDLIQESGSVVIVSHSISFLKSICTKLLVLDHGNILHYGEVEEGLRKYQKFMNLSEEKESKTSPENTTHQPSFRNCIAASIDLWRNERDSPRSVLISKLNKKIPMKLYMETINNVKSSKLGEFEHINEIDFTKMPEEFVIKPKDGASNNGVFVLRKIGENLYHDSMRNISCEPAEIVRIYLDEHKRFKSIHLPVYAEERYRSANDDFDVPLDYKGYCFNGKVALIMQRDVSGGRKASDWKFAYYDRNWKNLGEIREGIHYGSHLSPPKESAEIVREMEFLASKLPLKFCSMDMYNTDIGIAFGECTIHPGAYKGFDKEWDHKLGSLYEQAENPSDQVILDFLEENKSFFG